MGGVEVEGFMRVRGSLAIKVFAAVLGTASLLVAAMTLASVWRVDRGFARYVAHLELERLRGMVDQMQFDWAAQRGWGFVPTDPEGFRRWVNRSMGGTGPQPGEGPPWRQSRGDRPPPPENLRPGPPPGEGFERWPARGDRPPPRDDRESEGPPDRRRSPDRLAIGRRVAVFDVQGHRIAGANFDMRRTVTLPVVVGSEVVGHVALEPADLPREAMEGAFLREQWRDALWVGLGALILSGLVSVLFARNLRQPVQQLVLGTRALTKGQFAARLPINRSDEFALIAEHFNQMADQLGRQEQTRREWLASTSHELRTPLTVLRALIEALQEGVRKGDPGTLQRLHDQVMLLSQLVDDLHQLAQHDAGNVRLDTQRFEVRQLLDDVMDGQRQRLDQAGIAVTLLDHAGPVAVVADAQRLTQLFHNLIENTLRYTDAPGRLQITLSLKGAGRRDCQWHVEFDDTSPGVAMSALPRLFERFYRGESSRSRATGGSGLGLSICREIVLAHQGCIDVQPSPLGGLRVIVSLPCEAPV